MGYFILDHTFDARVKCRKCRKKRLVILNSITFEMLRIEIEHLLRSSLRVVVAS